MAALMLTLAGAFAAALAAGWLLVRFESWHAHFSHDQIDSGPQKFHARPTPRVGGVPVAIGMLTGLGLGIAQGRIGLGFASAFCLSVLPAFASGLVEDLTKRIGSDIRLWASFLSALIAMLMFDAPVTRSGFAFVDELLSWYPLAMVFTTVAVGGVAHAVNIIDGYNGLAGTVTCMMLAALGWVSWQVGDIELTYVCVSLLAGTLGFLRWNFPMGRLFAGDGGAYLWGVSAAIVAVLLTHRHAEVSPWFPAAVLIYPVFETLFSIYRRKTTNGAPAGNPDARHLHQLVHRRLLGPLHGARANCDSTRTRRNAATSPFLWTLAGASILPAALFHGDTAALVGIVVAFSLLYVWLYRAIVRFSVPHWLTRLGRHAARLAAGRHAGETS